MATSFNRKKTVGAFGSSKIREVGYHYEVLLNERAEPIPVSSGDPNRPNIANMIIEFSRPVISQAGGNHTAVRGAMNVAILIWNALVEGDAAVAAAREKLLALPDASPEQIDALIDSLRERKNVVAPGVNQIVRKFNLNFTKHGISFNVTTAPGSKVEGVEKSPNIAALGAK